MYVCLKSLRCNLMVLDKAKHKVLEVDLGQASVGHTAPGKGLTMGPTISYQFLMAVRVLLLSL